MIYGMVQNMLPEHLGNSIAKGAVEVEKEFPLRGLAVNLEGADPDEGVMQDGTVVFVMAERAALLQLLAVLGVPLV